MQLRLGKFIKGRNFINTPRTYPNRPLTVLSLLSLTETVPLATLSKAWIDYPNTPVSRHKLTTYSNSLI